MYFAYGVFFVYMRIHTKYVCMLDSDILCTVTLCCVIYRKYRVPYRGHTMPTIQRTVSGCFGVLCFVFG